MTTPSFEKFVTPMKDMSSLAIDTFESIAEIQMKSLEESKKIGFESIKAASEISDAEDLKSYMTEQTSTATKYMEGLTADMKAIGTIGQTYVTEAKKIAESAVAA